jgi:hypothetical protein
MGDSGGLSGLSNLLCKKAIPESEAKELARSS